METGIRNCLELEDSQIEIWKSERINNYITLSFSRRTPRAAILLIFYY